MNAIRGLKTSGINYIDGFGRHKHKKYKKARKHFYIKNCLGCKAYENDKCTLSRSIVLVNDFKHTKIHMPVNNKCKKPITWQAYEDQIKVRKYKETKVKR